MAPPLIQIKQATLSFGGSLLFKEAEFTVFERERLCLIGRNGSGKSTLLKVIAGIIEADHADRFVQPGVTMRYLHQEPDLSAYRTVRDYALSGLHGSDNPYRVDYLLDALGIDPGRSPENLSGGEVKRAALCRVLAPQPDVLLLDEPTNHLDLPAIEWLEGELVATRSAMILISHDRAFLQKLSTGTIWLDRGITHKIPTGLGGFEEWRDLFWAQEERNLQKLKQKIAEEKDWLRYGVTARRKRNVRRLGDLHRLRAEHAIRRKSSEREQMTARINSAEQSGKLVVEAVRISKSFAERKIVDTFSVRIARGERIGVVGPNGAGKTTLVKLLLKQIDADEGTVKLGNNLQIATLDQKRTSLCPSWTLKDALTHGASDSITFGKTSKHVISYMKDFLFTPEQVNTSIEALSGGERARVILARALSRPSNVIVLDEPTNDLDLETLDILQELLGQYDGTVFLVSHDRDFLDRIATITIAYEEIGQWRLYAGGYSDMIAQGGHGVRKTGARAASQTTRQLKEFVLEQTPIKPAKTKLSFKQEHALKSLPDEIARLERDIEKLHQALSDPDLYNRDPALFEKYTKALSKRKERLDKAETCWLELEELKQGRT